MLPWKSHESLHGDSVLTWELCSHGSPMRVSTKSPWKYHIIGTPTRKHGSPMDALCASVQVPMESPWKHHGSIVELLPVESPWKHNYNVHPVEHLRAIAGCPYRWRSHGSSECRNVREHSWAFTRRSWRRCLPMGLYVNAHRPSALCNGTSITWTVT